MKYRIKLIIRLLYKLLLVILISSFSLKVLANNDPQNNYESREIEGYITHDGRAKKIKEDFDKLANKPKLKTRFVEMKKNTTEGWEDYFLRLQNKANSGGIVIGVMLNRKGDGGHIMMITPGGVITIDNDVAKWGSSFVRVDRDITKVPRVLECGDDARESEAPLCRNVDYTGAINRLKWFEYLK